MKLFAFPFAGGSEHCYRELDKHLTRIQLRVQPLPGRGKLISQPCITNIDDMVAYVFANLKDEIDQSYALFGHSMGAFIAYMLCRKISNENLPKPKSLILSGRKAPSIEEQDPKHNMPRAQFRGILKKLGGVPDAVWQDEDIMTLFEPIIRADFELLETCPYQVHNALDVPFHVILGEDDDISSEQVLAWQNETLQALNITYFKGGHFYFKNDGFLLAKKITEELLD